MVRLTVREEELHSGTCHQASMRGETEMVMTQLDNLFASIRLRGSFLDLLI